MMVCSDGMRHGNDSRGGRRCEEGTLYFREIDRYGLEREDFERREKNKTKIESWNKGLKKR